MPTQVIFSSCRHIPWTLAEKQRKTYTGCHRESSRSFWHSTSQGTDSIGERCLGNWASHYPREERLEGASALTRRWCKVETKDWRPVRAQYFRCVGLLFLYAAIFVIFALLLLYDWLLVVYRPGSPWSGFRHAHPVHYQRVGGPRGSAERSALRAFHRRWGPVPGRHSHRSRLAPRHPAVCSAPGSSSVHVQRDFSVVLHLLTSRVYCPCIPSEIVSFAIRRRAAKVLTPVVALQQTTRGKKENKPNGCLFLLFYFGKFKSEQLASLQRCKKITVKQGVLCSPVSGTVSVEVLLAANTSITGVSSSRNA